MGLTRAERETVITMDDAGDVAYVYSAQPKMITRLRHNPAAVLVEEGVFEGARWARYTIPANLVSLRSVKTVPQLTEQQRAERRERMALLHQERARKAGSTITGTTQSP